MFRIEGGIIQSDEVDLFRDPEDVKQLAAEIIEDCRLDDRYANPEHRYYCGDYAEETAEEYRVRFEDAENLRSVGLSEENDLVFLEIFDYVQERKPPVFKRIIDCFRAVFLR